jgi:hypothetical protein
MHGCVLNTVCSSFCVWLGHTVMPLGIEYTGKRGCFHPQYLRKFHQQRQLWLPSRRRLVRILIRVPAVLYQVYYGLFQWFPTNVLIAHSDWQAQPPTFFRPRTSHRRKWKSSSWFSVCWLFKMPEAYRYGIEKCLILFCSSTVWQIKLLEYFVYKD